ncbi:MAG TPA: hypothetical protein VGO40_11675 [Longimicrobium sp.]|jgi:hypothetical protein|nr:hypothetical protein [Longimicrobium sp.]
MRKVMLNVDELAVSSFPTDDAPASRQGTVVANQPTRCPLTGPLPPSGGGYTCDYPATCMCPPESCS